MNYLRILTQGLLLLPDKIGDYLSILTRGLITSVTFLGYRVNGKYSTAKRSPLPYTFTIRSLYRYALKVTRALPYRTKARSLQPYILIYRGQGSYSPTVRMKGVYNG